MIEVKPLKAEDILYVVENGVKEIEMRATPDEDIKQLAKEREESGMCVTGWVDGEIVGVGGVDLLWANVGEVWLMLTPYINERPKEGYKCIRDGLGKLIKKCNLRRVQGSGRIGFHQAHILFKHLGFEAEGIMKKFTPDGVDCIMYARIEE
jgi:hypothetical protein